MKKGLTKILCILLTSILLISNTPKLKAASGNISVRSNKTTAVIGSEISVSIVVSSSVTIGSWQFTISYDSSKLKLTSGDPSVVEVSDGTSKSSKTYTYKFKVIARGTSTVTVKSYGALAWDTSTLSMTAGSTRITGITQAELEASYSKNNNLSSLGVTGYELTPGFNKDTTEYTVNVPSDVEKITLTGAVEDKKASINGLGEFDVSEGENKFDVTVTAENGSQKTYTVKINVQDANPIEVTIDGLKYTVVKRVSALTAPNTFEPTTVSIDGIEVPAFISNITGYTLVGLKSDEGTPNLYIYDAEHNTYTLYTEIKTEGLVIFPKIAKLAPKYYKKTKVTINETEVEAFQYDGVKDYYLIYGVNIETGSEGFYQYDMVNNTITRYNDKIINELTKKNENFLMIIIILGVETLVLLLIFIITLTRKGKNKKNKKVTFKDFEKNLEEAPIKEAPQQIKIEEIKDKKETPEEKVKETKEEKKEKKKNKKK